MKQTLEQAAKLIHSGGVIAYPSEAVFGLGCHPDNSEAVVRLLALKQRSFDKGLIVVAADFSQLQHYCAPLTEVQQQVVFATWPGPHTWLFPISRHCPRWLHGNHSTVAIRVSAHPLVIDLCRACRCALISTSANLSNQPPARLALEVEAMFPTGLDLIIDSEVGTTNKPTSIRDAVSGETIRA